LNIPPNTYREERDERERERGREKEIDGGWMEYVEICGVYVLLR
jgi:hypothetical protein